MKRLSKILRILVTGSLTMLLQACYGVVASMEPIYFIRLKAVDTNGEAIPELKISYQNNTYTNDWEVLGSTDESGEIGIDEQTYLDSNTNLKIEDVDGVENLGDFETKAFTHKDVINYTVEMIKK